MSRSTKTNRTISEPHIARCTGDEEWYTPAEYVEAARRAMGGIDCDPASCAIANQTVRASVYYTRDDDGLKNAWRGGVGLMCHVRGDDPEPSQFR